MGWVENTIWWHVYPLGFTGAPIREPDTEGPDAHRLRHLIGWLDYAVELGLSGLLLGPIFVSSTHGYDSLDQFQIDPRLGTEQDFLDLISECEARGLRVLLDGVFSHVGSQHPDVITTLEEGRHAAKAALFDIDWDSPQGPEPRVFEGHGSLVRLDHNTPETKTYVTQIMNHWLARGIDGWRLDAAYSVDPAFWRAVLPQVRQDHPDAWFLGEVIHGDYTKFIQESTVDSVTQYELWKAIWSSLVDQNFFELDWSLKRHNDFLEEFVPNTFIGNHDVTRIASTVGANGAIIAFIILMTVGGIPSVYYGDEQGFTGVKEENIAGDDAVRPPMPPTPADLLPLGEVAYACHRDLIGLRRRHPWLVTARTETISVDHTRYVYRSVAADSSTYLETEIDLSGETRAVIKDPDGQIIWGKPQI